MIMLSDIRDSISSLGIAKDENCYCGILPNKPDKAIGVYNLKRSGSPDIPLGGMENRSYDEKAVSILIHWNRSQRESDTAAMELFNKLLNKELSTINQHSVNHIKLLSPEPISVGTDEKGIVEYVIECIIFISKGD